MQLNFHSVDIRQPKTGCYVFLRFGCPFPAAGYKSDSCVLPALQQHENAYECPVR